MNLLSLADVAERLGIHIRTLKRRMDEFIDWDLPRPGRSVMFTEADYEKFVDRMRLRERAKSAPEVDEQKGKAKPRASQSDMALKEVRRQWKAEAKLLESKR